MRPFTFSALPLLLMVMAAAGLFGQQQQRQRQQVVLFDGKSLQGWVGADQAPGATPRGWTVEDGAIATVPGVPGGRRDLLSTVAIPAGSGFDFRFEFRLSARSNTGVKYFVQHTLRYLGDSLYDDSFGSVGLEFQLMDPAAAAVLPPNGRTGSVYSLVEPDAWPPIPIDVWIPARLVCDATHCEHWIGGIRVLAYEYRGAAFQQRLSRAAANPKQSVISSAAASAALHDAGGPSYLSLQHHDSKVWFRGLRLLLHP